MALATQNHTVQANERTYSYLHELQVGKEAEVRIMICRTWDTHTKYGKYLSTDFIASNEQGNVIQLTARNTVAHYFISRLKEGSVYLLNKFEVIPNKDDYRLLRDNKVLIQLQGSTFLKKISSDEHEGFVGHPYTGISFEDLEPNGGKYLIGTPVVNYTCKLFFAYLYCGVCSKFWASEGAGHTVGELGDSFLARKPAAPAQYSIILSSVSIRRDYYGGTSPSSTSATLIIDDTQIPTLDDFIKKISLLTSHDSLHCSDMEFADDMGELALQRQLRSQKKADVFKCTVELTNVRMKNGWYYNRCSIFKAKKSISRQNWGFWCESCDKKVPEPLTRFRIQFDARDSTAETVVVMFNEIAEQLAGTTAQSMLDAQDSATCTTILPNPLANLLNTTQVLLLKINSYYEHGTYESFNCIKVYSDEKDSVPLLSENMDPGTFSPAAKAGAASTIPSATTPKGVKRSTEILLLQRNWNGLTSQVSSKFIVTTSDSKDDTPAVAVNEMDRAGLSNA
ncbi:uncharacterized protein [Rutidosis leptorrhynchoides]|uniref:uncharacterized protein n=1 Tax=Rutidosis leptorrhynchoides TaxID=125765 RepID=UPI003A98F61B